MRILIAAVVVTSLWCEAPAAAQHLSEYEHSRSHDGPLGGRFSGRPPSDYGPRLGPVTRPVRPQDFTVSLADLQAPKKARKAYEKGVRQLSGSRFAGARESFEKAISVYPQFPSAWLEIGKLHWQNGELEAARDAFQKTVDADPKSWRGWSGLANVASKTGDWEALAWASDQVLDIMPFASPAIFVYNAAAKYNLGELEAAENRAREAIARGDNEVSAKGYHVLGLVQARRGKYELASSNLRRYLQERPDAHDLSMVQRQLAVIERMSQNTLREPAASAAGPNAGS